MNNKMMNTMNTKNYVNKDPQCKTWQKAQWYGWWITQNKNIAKQGGCIIDANMNLNTTKDMLPQILWKMKSINCCKNEQATNIKPKQIKDIAKTQNKVKNENVSKNSWQRHEHFLPLLITNNERHKRDNH